MIIDGFTYFCEEELLKIRLNYLNPIIDRFIIVEANKTHSGLDKPLYYNENKDKFKEFHSKIVHVIVNNMPPVVNDNRWALENFQRNAIQLGLDSIALEPDDYLLISDVDEIPNRDLLHLQQFGTYDQKCFMYYLNVQSEDHWNGTIGMKYKLFKSRFGNPQAVRDQRNHLEPIRNGGWHFGWCGGYYKVLQKIKAFAHTEIDRPEYMNPLRETIRNIKPIWCPNGSPMRIVKIDDTFPDYINENIEELTEKGLICLTS